MTAINLRSTSERWTKPHARLAVLPVRLLVKFWGPLLMLGLAMVLMIGSPTANAQANSAGSAGGASASPGAATNPSTDKAALVLHIRHALAPGGGDPSHFDVNDCATQRNLNEVGRDQSRDIGRQLRALGIEPTHIWSSQWCRSFETAELLGLGEVTALPSLNSFFQNRAAGPEQMAELRAFLRNLDPAGGPYVMVSHQVVVGSLTNTWVASGDGVWLVLTGDPQNPWIVHRAETENLTLPPGF